MKKKKKKGIPSSAVPPGEMPTAAPLAAWILFVLLSLGLLSGSWLWMTKLPAPPLDEADLDGIRRRIDGAGRQLVHRRQTGEKLVLVVGTSLTQAAFFKDARAKAVAADMGYPGISFLRIDQNGPLLVHRLVPLFNDILRAAPDAVLIEDQVLTWYRERREPGFLDAHRKFVLSTLRSFFSAGTESRAFTDPHLDAELDWQDHFENFKRWSPAKQAQRMAALHSDEELYRLKMRRDDWSGCPGELPDALSSFLEEARRRKIPVALLDIVPSEPARRVMPRRFVDCQERMNGLVGNRYDVPLLVSPQNMPLSHYMDYAHYNRDGRIAFTRWILPELRRMLQQEDRN